MVIKIWKIEIILSDKVAQTIVYAIAAILRL
jgi:hypothetical protein